MTIEIQEFAQVNLCRNIGQGNDDQQRATLEQIANFFVAARSRQVCWQELICGRKSPCANHT